MLYTSLSLVIYNYCAVSLKTKTQTLQRLRNVTSSIDAIHYLQIFRSCCRFQLKTNPIRFTRSTVAKLKLKLHRRFYIANVSERRGTNLCPSRKNVVAHTHTPALIINNM